MDSVRIDVLVHRLGLASSRTKAQRLIQAGQVRVDGQVVDKVGTQVAADAEVTVQPLPRYVGRGAYKLIRALDRFELDPSCAIAADVGASTGGFTQVLLDGGAKRVYAIDVGYGQLHWRLRKDPRVVVMERTNARYLDALPEPVEIVTIDVSFISLRLILPRVADWLAKGGQVVALIKPQFEAGRDEVGKGGIVRDTAVHRQVLQSMVTWCVDEGWRLRGCIASPITGSDGNIEFLCWLDREEDGPGMRPEDIVARALKDVGSGEVER
jgi:23S rRNA (cytidine1920-2'-O)/16S rRNA (cytidine1409-2'-O)-methyltransferase